jgi:NAD(P)-dependent dehydrogenase (short-subunit alcohol dehydrogenase family)
MNVTGSVAVVTGGASGIGLALGRELADAGACVVLADVCLDRAREAARSLAGRADAVHVDVSRNESVEELVTDTVRAHGRLDFMFNNAGLAVVGEVRDLGLDHWHRVIDTNLWGVIHGSRAAYRIMVAQGHGHIVNTASGFGLVPGPFNAPYATSKFAVVGFSESLRAEAADLGVRVSVVCPGFVKTAIFEHTEVVNVGTRDLLPGPPVQMISAEDAARRILRGVSCNEGVIAFPSYVKLLVGLYRFSPGLAFRLSLKTVRAFRKRRGT